LRTKIKSSLINRIIKNKKKYWTSSAWNSQKYKFRTCDCPKKTNIWNKHCLC